MKPDNCATKVYGEYLAPIVVKWTFDSYSGKMIFVMHSISFKVVK